MVRPLSDAAPPGPDGHELPQLAGTHLPRAGRQQGSDAACHVMIEALHRADERDVCESMAIADTSAPAGPKEATRRCGVLPCPFRYGVQSGGAGSSIRSGAPTGTMNVTYVSAGSEVLFKATCTAFGSSKKP